MPVFSHAHLDHANTRCNVICRTGYDKNIISSTLWATVNQWHSVSNLFPLIDNEVSLHDLLFLPNTTTTWLCCFIVYTTVEFQSYYT